MCCTCNHEKKTSSQVEKVWTGWMNTHSLTP
jgi:hypothetical protein